MIHRTSINGRLLGCLAYVGVLFSARLGDGKTAGVHVLSMMRTLKDDNLFVFHPLVAGAAPCGMAHDRRNTTSLLGAA